MPLVLEGPPSDGIQQRSDTVTGKRALLLYVIVGAAYIGTGVFFEILLFSWLTGAIFMLAGVWLVPLLVHRWAGTAPQGADPDEEQP